LPFNKSPISKSDIFDDLRNIGVSNGDTLFLRADLGQLGKTDFRISQSFIDILLDAVGPTGTLVTLTFSKTYPVSDATKENYFYPRSPSTSGALAKLFLKHPDAIRSKHPANSFTAIGMKATEICAGHTANSPPYFPMKYLIEQNALMLIIGCTESSPGFTSVHWNQYELGYAQQSFIANRNATFYQDGDNYFLYSVASPGGCSAGFGKFYAEYLANQKLVSGFVGNAYSVAIKARRAADIERNLLEKNPKFALCDDPDCWKCRATWRYNKMDKIKYHFRQKLKLLRLAFSN
jgi:aminoglycoside 3-N-acetyltransferase